VFGSIDARDAFKSSAKIWLAGRICHSTASTSYSGTVCRRLRHSGEYSAELGATPQKTIGRGSNSAAINRAKAGIAGSIADSSNVIATE